MKLIVVYDISDNSNREAIARKLKNLGLTRVQRSVFVGRGGKGVAMDVYRAVKKYVTGDGDSVIIFNVPNQSVREALVLGCPMGDLRGLKQVVVL